MAETIGRCCECLGEIHPQSSFDYMGDRVRHKHRQGCLYPIKAERDLWKKRYEELRDALCSKSWAPRDKPEMVIKLAARMRAKELIIRPAVFQGAD